MVLTSSGTISFSSIRSEYLGSSNTSAVSFSQFYNNGIYTPLTVPNAPTGFPSSGAIKFSNFYGGNFNNGTMINSILYLLVNDSVHPYRKGLSNLFALTPYQSRC